MKLNLSFWIKSSNRRKRIYSFLFVLVLSIVLMTIGSLVPISKQNAHLIVDPLNQTIAQNQESGTLPQTFFLHNFPICLIMFIPVLGTAFGLLSFFVTGYALGGISLLQGVSPLQNVSFLLLAPHTWLEFIAYALAVSESIWLLRRLTQKRFSELKNTAILIGVCAGLLVLAAFVETWLISIGA
ncbi:MAG: stage II sporulation protein M [Candidatus Bathyarchaeia archaeon]